MASGHPPHPAFCLLILRQAQDEDLKAPSRCDITANMTQRKRRPVAHLLQGKARLDAGHTGNACEVVQQKPLKRFQIRRHCTL